MNKYVGGLLIIMILILTSCVPQAQNSTIIVGCDYDEKADRTDYFVFPYGEVGIPGKWEKVSYNQETKQQLFEDVDSVSLAISFAPCNKYEFCTGKTETGFEFVKAYYEWEFQYFVSQQGLEVKIIEQDSLNNFIIWWLGGELNDDKIDNYFLFGEHNSYVSNFSILTTDKWTEKEKIEFLKNLFMKK